MVGKLDCGHGGVLIPAKTIYSVPYSFSYKNLGEKGSILKAFAI